MKCNVCPHRQWEEGDREHSPPGYGVYFCDLTEFGALSEAVAKGDSEPSDCPLLEKQPAPYDPDKDPTAGKPWPIGLDAGRMGVVSKTRTEPTADRGEAAPTDTAIPPT